MRISDWSSDVCSSDLLVDHRDVARGDSGRGTHFLVALEEAVIERAVGIRLARQDVVAHRANLLGKRRAVAQGDLRLERALRTPGGFIFLADRVLDPRRTRLGQPVYLV